MAFESRFTKLTHLWNRISDQPISCHWSLCIPPEKIRKPEVFWCFQMVQKETSGMKWVIKDYAKHLWYSMELFANIALCFSIIASARLFSLVWDLFSKTFRLLYSIYPFHTNVSLLYPLKTSKNVWFYEVFKVYRNETLVWNELINHY